jgi:hypothetical protein
MMKLRILGCSGGIGGDLRTTSMLLGHDVLIDAGTGVGDLSLEMREIRECAGTYQPGRLENNQVFEL